jgi:hypothetical protein
MEYVKQGATIAFTLDVVVALAWSACGITILATDCLDLALLHAVIFVHFGVHTVALATLFEDIRRDEWEQKHGAPHQALQAPIAWATAVAITLVGDLFLVSYDAMHFSREEADNRCLQVSAFQLAVDAANSFVALCSLVCYVVAVYHIKQRHRHHHQEVLDVDNPGDYAHVLHATDMVVVPSGYRHHTNKQYGHVHVYNNF